MFFFISQFLVFIHVALDILTADFMQYILLIQVLIFHLEKKLMKRIPYLMMVMKHSFLLT